MPVTTRRMALLGLLTAPGIALAADEPPPWPTPREQDEMVERVRLVARAEYGGPPIPEDLPRQLALDVTRLLKELRRRDARKNGDIP